MRIFISYTTRDNEVSIQALRSISSILGNIGKVFIDILDNDSTNKQERVFNELEQSNLIVLINSSNIYKSQWVLREMKIAQELDIPVVVLTVYEILHMPMEEMLYKFTAICNSVDTESRVFGSLNNKNRPIPIALSSRLS